MGYRDLTGVDISPPASGGSITYRQADLDCFRLDVPEGAFDLALEGADVAAAPRAMLSGSPIASSSSSARTIASTASKLMKNLAPGLDSSFI